jgi:hypothetical protein
MIINVDTRGANDPGNFSVVLHGTEFFSLTSSSFRAFEKQYKAVQDRREAFTKETALEAKIERSRVIEYKSSIN